MANQDAEAGPAVEYKAQSQETDAVEIRSPAKNRYKGTPLSTTKSPSKSTLPKLFERISSKWWDPQFDSDVLEKQLISSYFRLTRRRFQYALLYIVVACIAWCAFFAAIQETNWIPFVAGSVVLLSICLALFGFTFSALYERWLLQTSVVVAIVLCGFCLLNFISVGPVVSAVGTFTGATEILLLLYTVIPLPLYITVLIGVLYSIAFEVLSGTLTSMSAANYIIGRILLHVCIHMIGIHTFLMSQARKRSTFLKVGQSIMSRRDLELEKQLKQRMIHSLMPPTVAEEIMKSREKEEKVEEDEGAVKRPHGAPSPQRGQIKFRSFHMSQLSNVSILFADIVGFTNMSSNKTAEHLVSLLNDLFGRFDVLCTKSGCEKISTLGDCYYCVSGCPEPKVDHAQCCIEMGLGMVKAIQMFDEDHNEQVNMRVGVHTGTVLCGLVGTRRFKFDVWSNDVTLANMMESEGKPGLVHISQPTYQFVQEDYEVEEGEEVEDIRMHKVLIEDYNTETQQYQVRHVQDKDTIKTYFVVKRLHPIQVGPTSPASPREKTAGESAESVKVAVEDKDDTQTPSQDASTHGAPVSPTSDSNHVNGQTDANGMSPALLLGRRDNLATSLEELSGEKDDSKDVKTDALLKQTQQRVHSDKALISCMHTDATAQEYLHRPPINQCTLSFTNSNYESEYRHHYLADKHDGASTFSSPRVSAFFDMAVSFLFLALISAGCFLGFPIRAPWIIFFAIAVILEILMLLPLIVDVWIGGKIAANFAKVSQFFSSWYPRHIFGAILASLPVITVYANFSCHTFGEQPGSDIFICLMVVVSLLHYCNFTMLSSWMKSSLATIAGLVLLILLGIGVCSKDALFDQNGNNNNNATLAYTVQDEKNNVSLTTVTGAGEDIFLGHHQLRFEMILNMALLLLLVWFLNREFEISYRLSFHGDLQAILDRKTMQTEKEQADWLLHNIIPQHVSDVLKKTSKYCKNHTDVGVIFAKVVNFDDFYDESFKGGREYLRVLNELISDFEDLFDDPKYKDVEKIKTIGSCLMAASGLNPNTRNENKDPKAHLYALVDFSMDLLAKLEQFNMEIFNFDFEMSIGYNTGEVTAGVIGTTKLLYDIWGDTVNISSRMYSTGVHGRIQVTEDTANKLEDKFDFEYRGQTYVKGKGDMNTYLVVQKKEGASWE